MIKKTSTLTKIALMAALLCIISPFAMTLPFSPVPISLATLMLYLSVYIVGKKDAVISCGIYLLIGLVGLPVFSGFTGGIGKVLGPTGGYMIGYLFLVYISGWFVEKGSSKRNFEITENMSSAGQRKRAESKIANKPGYIMQGLGLILGTAVCYLFGTIWLVYQAGLDIFTALGVGVLPFIPGDIVKIVIGVVAGNAVKKRLVKAGVV